ncbi:MAG: response regulator [Candidatus Kapabacteria bacterium]|nr:response regulator [Candidatus Kapabacteria bacterium]
MEQPTRPVLHLTALLVEDSALDADVLIRFLRYHDIEIVYERVDTIPQLQAALNKEWDVIFCDYNIHTGFTGMDALNIIRKTEQERGVLPGKPDVKIPVIMISSILNENAVVTAMNAGASDFIIKGYLERLVPMLHREIGYVRKIQEYFAAWQAAQAQK